MSGSPVAAISLSLFSAGTISDVESFAMINGSRLGASFIVLFVGFLQYVWHRRTRRRPVHRRRRPARRRSRSGCPCSRSASPCSSRLVRLDQRRHARRDHSVHRRRLRPDRRAARRTPLALRDVRRRHRRPAHRLHDLRPRAPQPRAAEPAGRAHQGWLHHPLAMFALGPRDHGDDTFGVDLAHAADPAVAEGLRHAATTSSRT